MIGRSGTRYVAESVAIRFENMKLLQDLILLAWRDVAVRQAAGEG